MHKAVNNYFLPGFRQSHIWQSAWLALVRLALSFRYLDFICWCSYAHIDVLFKLCVSVLVFLFIKILMSLAFPHYVYML